MLGSKYCRKEMLLFVVCHSMSHWASRGVVNSGVTPASAEIERGTSYIALYFVWFLWSSMRCSVSYIINYIMHRLQWWTG